MSTTKLATKRMTAEELEQLPDDGYRYELVRGELIRMAPANFEHAEIVGNLIFVLQTHVKPRGLDVVGPEGGFILEREPDTVRAPDVVFVRADRAPRGALARHFAEMAPDLAVEVRSPSDSMASLLAKADEYLARGAQLVWVFDPVPRRVHIRRADGSTAVLSEGDELDGGDVLPDFRVALREIFPPRAPAPAKRKGD